MMEESLFYASLGAALVGKLYIPPKLASEVLKTLAHAGATRGTVVELYADLYPTLPPLGSADLEVGIKLIERTLRAGVVALPVTSPAYPKSLALIDDAPPVIYYRGTLSTLSQVPGLAVVGTRKATPNGLVIAERIGKYFAEAGWVIVSGLALGIDAAAHRGALQGQGRTIAVMAHGLGTIYPKANAPLADEILASGGLLLSEYPVGIPAKPEQFVLRNRIQIGLSVGSVIVEGEEKSGTRTQAEYCLKNRRHLFAVLQNDATSALNLVSSLPMQLVSKRGAMPIYSRDDYARVENMLNAKKAQILGDNAILA
ncbi:DNA-processing protein DprA [Massilia oculi]|uniref:DNA processing protein DprA n=1 Tax=Massilia oculi TaxID=945844 RepID=A0A2S2DEQ2_9BURK|nr:DNA-processing protein DprA [Massilia oculi]AWL03824.1 DNA processing protein DprA [Massilia oculi]